MMYDEAMAAVELDEQFWAELRTSETKFLWWPQYNALTGRRMWLCNAVRAFSGRTVEFGSGIQYEFTTTRWYKPRDFVIEKLSRG
jgi:hypothetical protein